MHITRETVVRKLDAYLHHQLSLDDLVAWANAALMEGDFEEKHFDAIRDVVARLGLADVRAFWPDVGRVRESAQATGLPCPPGDRRCLIEISRTRRLPTTPKWMCSVLRVG